MAQAKAHEIPDDATIVICTTGTNKTDVARIYHSGPRVVMLCPPGEAARFTASNARAAAEALTEHALKADQYVQAARQRPAPPPHH
jgi:DNA-binding LacI/PurR family transcriptional regulator